jgi:hypothetical protein
MIKCGRCGQYHESVADVRKCFNGEDVTGTQGTLPAGKRLSEAQVGYAKKLLSQLNAVYTAERPIEDLGRSTDGRELLDGLVAARKAKTSGLPYKLPANVAQSANPASETAIRTVVPEIPHGYYATPSATGNNDYDFWFVNVVTREGKWEGFRSVSRVIGGRSPVRVPGKTRVAALKTIEDFGVDKAGNLFADEMERCRKCGRHLTDELSRKRRMGPDCFANAS